MPTSSLLAGDQDDAAPSLLSTCPVNTVDQSPLEQLISRSTAQAHEAAASYSYINNNDNINNTHSLALDGGGNVSNSNNNVNGDDMMMMMNYTEYQQRQQQAPSTYQQLSMSYNNWSLRHTSLNTIAAGSLTLFNIVFIWIAYVSNSWFDTHIKFSVDWVSKFIPVFENYTDTLLYSINLATIVSMLQGAELHGVTILVVLTALFLPCLCMILLPVWIVSDHKDTSNNKLPVATTARSIFEHIMRLSFLIAFVLLLLNVGTSSIELMSKDTDLRLYNQIRRGLVSYTIGTACALGVIVILRTNRYPLMFGDNHNNGNSNNNNNSRRPLRFPPPGAFQLPWRHRISDVEQQQQQQALLEDNNYSINETTEMDRTSPRMQNLQVEDDNDGEERPSSSADDDDDDIYPRLGICQKIILFEVGTLAVLLWFPALFFPLFRLSFHGIASEFVTIDSFQVCLWEFVSVIWHQGTIANTNHWTTISVCLVFIQVVYVVPMLVTILTVLYWTSRQRKRQQRAALIKTILNWLVPALCSLIFAMGVVATIPAFGPVGNYLLDQQTGQICEKFENFMNETCLTIEGQVSLGGWFLLVQSIALEVFVLLTLWWS